MVLPEAEGQVSSIGIRRPSTIGFSMNHFLLLVTALRRCYCCLFVWSEAVRRQHRAAFAHNCDCSSEFGVVTVSFFDWSVQNGGVTE